MSDSVPAPLTEAERVALRIAAEALRASVDTLKMQWDHFEEIRPNEATSEVKKGFRLATHWLVVRADTIERNVASG